MSKFSPTGQSVHELFAELKTVRKQEDAYKLLELHQRISQEEAVVWYPSIIGFGCYHYKYDTGTEGDSPILAFAARQAKISLYIDQNLPGRQELLDRLGKHKAAVGCVYVNKLADIDMEVLEEILVKSIEYHRQKGE
ncbi:DUF1801 domain-containing protein [Streptococcus sp. P25B114]|uniref:DUF1801 domain-containing protein n=1 Tax=Streptococcus suis TaxID=1307 RepID=A0A3R8R6Y7_STRSU|nr:DUF1801 domain-containing protein [Streptococcus suis]NQH33531.1 DUF1801 domain-containing protein [Streptococcus suis]NQH95836.1 DUF1801 domain-containing protein [Streptococcus suis]NQL62346.1 DUF1801 domain-containing protein [Streptococcus suis]NQO46372.1 DUF1801 domain-containing protein [Streptococcus suis]RRR51745.1 DUF1801 domain-containing protein [Streptococcus suis]